MTEQTQTLPRWDLSNVYPGLDSPEFASDFSRFGELIDELEHYVNEEVTAAGPDADTAALVGILSTLVERFNEVLLLSHTMRAYIHAFVSTDTADERAQRAASQYEQVAVRLHTLITRVQSWIGRLADRLPEVLEIPGTAKDHAFFLREIAEQSKYLMSEAEESLAAELNLSGAHAWSKLQQVVTSQQTAEIEMDGQKKTLPITAIINLRSHPDEAVRRAAYEVENRVWDSVRAPLAATLNGVKGTVIVLDRRRGRRDNLHAALDDARIDAETLEVMLSAMRDSFPIFRRYFLKKAARLGKEKLAWWDLFAPIGKVESTFTFERARDFVLEHFASFSQDLSDFAAQAFERNWIDAEQRKGKVAGAFCMSVPRVKESRVLTNFDGSLDQVFTIAHELGHGYHNHCQFRAGKTELQRANPMTLAETASIMCETIVLNATLQQAASPQEELAILETSLISDSQVIVDIYSRFLFEREVFARRAKAELSADELCEIMAWAQREAYGEGLDERYLQPYMWTWKPHYYSAGLSFYNFPYAFGLLFGIGLYAVYQSRGKDFVPDYQALLASTGEAMPVELAGRFGIDIRSKEFWKRSLDVIAGRIERYLAID